MHYTTGRLLKGQGDEAESLSIAHALPTSIKDFETSHMFYFLYLLIEKKKADKIGQSIGRHGS